MSVSTYLIILVPINELEMKVGIIGILCLVAASLPAQNLVNNPGFETISSAPTSFGQIANATGWYSAYGTGDLFHPAAGAGSVGIPTNYFGTQAAHGGGNFGGVATSSTNVYHELIGVTLSTPLTAGQSYYCEAYVSAGETAYRYGSNNFGFKFANSAITGTAANPPIASPDVNWTPVILNYSGWTLVSGTFTATAASTHLVLGNFFSTAATTWTLHGGGGTIDSQYWFIDDVVVQPNVVFDLPAHTLQARPLGDNLIVVDWEFQDPADAQELSLLRSLDGGTSWQDCARMPATQMRAHTHSDRPMRWGEDIFYRLRMVQADGTVHYSETVSAQLPLPGIEESLAIAPNPLTAGQECLATFAAQADGPAEWRILDMAGRQLDRGQVDLKTGTAQVHIPTQGLQSGSYLLRIQAGASSATRKLMVW